ncbi:MAG: ABC transporter permease [Candidatus Zixiibacteriota bacterium]|nr:MAG: ABC transporter permease [candidate division Zixibacteria bacterium]
MSSKSTDNLPRLAIWLLQRVVYYENREYAAGDFVELYRDMLGQGSPFRARVYLWLEIVRSLPGFVNNTVYWSFTMLKSYLTTAFRNMIRQKAHTVINISGLAVGFACSMLIALYVVNELSYDCFHEKADRVYRITWPDDVNTQPALAPTLQAVFPQVEAATGFANLRVKRVKYQDRVFYESPIRSASHEVFDIFSFPLVSGDTSNALKDPNTVVLTRSMAIKYFDDGVDPVDKMITIGDNDYRIDGVMEDVPENSHFSFQCLISNNSFGWYHENIWNRSWMATYVLLRSPSDVSYIESKLPELITAYIFNGNAEHDWRYIMQPLTSIHLHSHLRFELGSNGDFGNVIIFSTAALLMIIIACINFMNLTTAKSMVRIKEIGIRRTMGSSRRQLIQQFLGESMLMSLLAMVVGLILVFAILPEFYLLVGSQIGLAGISLWTVIAGLVCLSILVGLLAGSYPAFYLSSFRPARVMKGALAGGRTSSGFRNGLVVFQFVVSIVLLIGTFTVYRQLDYVQNRDLGFNKDQVLVIKNLEPDPLRSDALKQKLLQHANVVSVSNSGNLPGAENGRQAVQIEGTDATSLNVYSCDYDYLETLQLDMAGGRFFSRSFGTDTAGIILNERAVETYNIENPIGKRAMVNLGRIVLGNVIGVVKDFHFRSLHDPIEPLAMVYGIKKGWGINYVSIRFGTEDMAGTIQYIKEMWESVNPGLPFDYTFLDEDYNALYTNERTAGRTVLVFCLLAVVVCCLGLYGLSTFVIERRVKEIGIRKVVGASMKDIVWILSRGFLGWVVLAFVLAVPLAWIVLRHWLQNFAYRVDLEVWVFGVSGALALLIALATVGFQSVRAALANPVESLRHE